MEQNHNLHCGQEEAARRYRHDLDSLRRQLQEVQEQSSLVQELDDALTKSMDQASGNRIPLDTH